MAKSRRHFSAREKVSILRAHFVDNVRISDLCDKHGLHPNMFYRWQKQFFENGDAAFERKASKQNGHLEQKIEKLEDKLQRKNEVLSELMEEHVALKKTLGEI